MAIWTGREGVIGAPVLLRSEAVALHRTIVQGPGSAWMIGSSAFLAAADDLPRLRTWCLRYLYSTHAEAVQTAACHALHPMTARFARRLLMTYDRMEGDTVLLTQEHVSQMLGVRRASVTRAASALQARGAIRYSRGRITVVDPSKLETIACECYRIDRDEMERIAGPPPDLRRTDTAHRDRSTA